MRIMTQETEAENIEGSQQSNTTVDIPQLIQYLKYLHQQNRKSDVNYIERFRNVNCFQDIFGSSTLFKLTPGPAFNYDIKPLSGFDSPDLCVFRSSKDNTCAMSVNNRDTAPFLTFVNVKDVVSIFSPDIQEPIGQIVRRKGRDVTNDEADIFCFATNTTFTMINFKTNSHISMKILDSNRKVLGTAHVTSATTWRGNYFDDSINLKEFAFQFDDGISEPTKVMFLVAFTNWAKWARDEIDGRGISWKMVFFGCFLLMCFLVWLCN